MVLLLGKEVTASLALSIPRTENLKFDGKLNVTLPGFVPMVIILKLDEKKSGEYDVSTYLIGNMPIYI